MGVSYPLVRMEGGVPDYCTDRAPSSYGMELGRHSGGSFFVVGFRMGNRSKFWHESCRTHAAGAEPHHSKICWWSSK